MDSRYGTTKAIVSALFILTLEVERMLEGLLRSGSVAKVPLKAEVIRLYSNTTKQTQLILK